MKSNQLTCIFFTWRPGCDDDGETAGLGMRSSLWIAILSHKLSVRGYGNVVHPLPALTTRPVQAAKGLCGAEVRSCLLAGELRASEQRVFELEADLKELRSRQARLQEQDALASVLPEAKCRKELGKGSEARDGLGGTAIAPTEQPSAASANERGEGERSELDNKIRRLVRHIRAAKDAVSGPAGCVGN